jgi:hypothetical protein
VLVLTPDLEQVKEVGGRGVDGDEVFAGFGDGRGEVEDFEVFRSLVVLASGVDMRIGKLYTWTYSLICMPFIVETVAVLSVDEMKQL